MKKVKVLALVLAVALMLSGIGYALWSDSIVLKSTANTGDINVDFCEALLSVGDELAWAEIDELTRMEDKKYLEHDPEDYLFTEIIDDSNDAYFTEDEIYFTVSNLYPQAKYELKYKVKNNGTVPVKLKGFTVSPYDEGDKNELYYQLCKKDQSSDGYAYIDQTGIGEIVDCSGINEIKTLTTTFVVPDWGDQDFENLSCTYKITLNWEQVEVTTSGE